MSDETLDYANEEYFDVEGEESDVESTHNIDVYDITSFPVDYTLATLVEQVKKNRITLPPFQRKFVWDEVRQSRLIESFLLGLPVPQIFLFKRKKNPSLYVIDGYQRIKTIERFLENKLVLKGVHKRWEGKKFDELDEDDKSRLENSPLRAIIIQQHKPQDEDSSMFYIFERLNTGGMRLYPMEIRRAIFYGKFAQMLESLNKYDAWRKIIGRRQEDKRMRDVEWVLRFYAFYYTDVQSEYTEPLKEFLNKFMSKYRDISDAEMEMVFKNTCDKIVRALGEKPFHYPRGKLNLAVMDSVMVAVAKNPSLSLKDITTRYEELKKNEQFNQLISVRDTSKTRYVKERFRLVFHVFGVAS